MRKPHQYTISIHQKNKIFVKICYKKQPKNKETNDMFKKQSRKYKKKLLKSISIFGKTWYINKTRTDKVLKIHFIESDKNNC